MEDSVAMRLVHFSVDVVTGIAEICDFLSQKLNSLGRVAEYNALVDLKLCKV